MSARMKAAILIVTAAVVIWIGSSLGNAVEAMGEEISENRSVLLDR